MMESLNGLITFICLTALFYSLLCIFNRPNIITYITKMRKHELICCFTDTILKFLTKLKMQILFLKLVCKA